MPTAEETRERLRNRSKTKRVVELVEKMTKDELELVEKHSDSHPEKPFSIFPHPTKPKVLLIGDENDFVNEMEVLYKSRDDVFKSTSDSRQPTNNKEIPDMAIRANTQSNNGFKLPSFDFSSIAAKLMDNMFRQVDSTIDITTGKVGIMTEEGLVTLEVDQDNPEESSVSVNVMGEGVAMTVPAFAMRTDIKKIKPGDIICTAKDKLYFVLAVKTKQLVVLKPDGNKTTYNMSSMNFGGTQGFFVVRNMWGNMFATDSEDGQMNPMMLMMLAGNQEGGDMFKLMLMSQMFKGNGGEMNPMMLMLMANQGNSGNDMSQMMQMMLMSKMF